jgi:hypothetical protein
MEKFETSPLEIESGNEWKKSPTWERFARKMLIASSFAISACTDRDIAELDRTAAAAVTNVRNSVQAATAEIHAVADSVAIERELQSLSPDEKAEVQGLLESIKEALGRETTLRDLARAGSSLSEQNKERITVAEGFDAIGLENDFVRIFWENGYPTALIRMNTDSVVYMDSLPTVELEGDARGPGSVDGRSFGNRDRIILYRQHGWEKAPTIPHVLTTLDVVFAHEAGHQSDWRSSRDLSMVQRIRFLHDVVTEKGSSASYKDSYPFSKDQVSSSDSLVVRHVEWWAELAEVYFQNPEGLRDDYPSSYALAHKWLTRLDPTFDPVRMRDWRDDAINNQSGHMKIHLNPR